MSKPSKPALHQYLNSIDVMLDQSKHFRNLVAPLYNHFGFNSAAYYHIYENGEVLHLASETAFQEQIYQRFYEKGKRFSITSNLNNAPKQGYYLVDAGPSKAYSSTLQQLLDKYDLHHQFMSFDRIATDRGPALRITIFSGPPERDDINQFYLNNLGLIKRINNHLTQQLEPITNKMPLIKPTRKEFALAQQYFTDQGDDKNPIADFVKETDLHYPRYKELAEITLSKREKEVIYWYLRGKTTSETATILGINDHTVRTYFDRLKKKLGCYFKSQLLLKLIDGEFISSDDWKDIY